MLAIILAIVFWRHPQTQIFPMDYIVRINESVNNGSDIYSEY